MSMDSIRQTMENRCNFDLGFEYTLIAPHGVCHPDTGYPLPQLYFEAARTRRSMTQRIVT